MIFKAVKFAGKLEIENVHGERKSYDVFPMDVHLMKKLEKLKDEQGSDAVIAQFELFCKDFDPADLEGIPSSVLEEMVQYVVDVSSGKKRTEAEKKTPSRERMKS
jgi:hypothetical protein